MSCLDRHLLTQFDKQAGRITKKWKENRKVNAGMKQINWDEERVTCAVEVDFHQQNYTPKQRDPTLSCNQPIWHVADENDCPNLSKTKPLQLYHSTIDSRQLLQSLSSLKFGWLP